MSHSLTLFLDLNEGTKPDLAVVARAALEFDALVKELAFQIDPSALVKLDLESGTQGSLKLNSWLKSAKDKALDPKVQWAIVLGVLFHFGEQGAGYLTTKLFEEAENQILGDGTSLSEDEIKAIAEELADRLERGAGKEQASRVYRELQADENITGVGVSPIPDTRPTIVVPRIEFQARGTMTSDTDTTETKRERTEVVEAVLLRPVLQLGNYRWKFAAGGIEFGAVIKDEAFMSDLVAGRHHIEMRGGIIMTLQLEIVEEFSGQAWVIKERTVRQVLKTEAGLVQIEFPSPPPETNGSDNAQ